MVINAVLIAKAMGCAFFAILFIQSGFDKIFDRKGNLEWMVPHFAKSAFKNLVPLLLSALTVLEVASGLGALAALYFVLFTANHGYAVLGLSLSGLAFLCLFLGQRVAKDYAAAVTLASYFAVWLITMYLLAVGYEISRFAMP